MLPSGWILPDGHAGWMELNRGAGFWLFARVSNSGYPWISGWREFPGSCLPRITSARGADPFGTEVGNQGGRQLHRAIHLLAVFQ